MSNTPLNFQINNAEFTAGINQQIRNLQQIGPALNKHLRGPMTQAVTMTAREIKDNAPEITGRYVAGIKSKVTTERSTVGSLKGKVSGTHHAWLVEHGRKPGKMPNVASMVNMITDGGSPEDEWRRAYALARSIARKGTQGRNVFQKAWAAVADRIPPLFYAVLDKLTAELTVKQKQSNIQELTNGR